MPSFKRSEPRVWLDVVSVFLSFPYRHSLHLWKKYEERIRVFYHIRVKQRWCAVTSTLNCACIAFFHIHTILFFLMDLFRVSSCCWNIFTSFLLLPLIYFFEKKNCDDEEEHQQVFLHTLERKMRKKSLADFNIEPKGRRKDRKRKKKYFNFYSLSITYKI